MTLVQASIAEGGDAVIITSDRLLSRQISEDVPHYEFEENTPKIIPRKKVAIGFAGSQLHADNITSVVEQSNLVEYEEIVDEVSKHIQENRRERINKEIERRTGIKEPDMFFERPDLPIPQEVRNRIYGLMGPQNTIINARCIIAGFDEKNQSRLAIIDSEGDELEATEFGEVSIGSGAPFSTIYFDQHGYNIECDFGEGILFNFEAKKWAEAPTGVGPTTDMITLQKRDEQIVINEIYEGHDLLDDMEKYYKNQKRQIREERKELRESLASELDEEDQEP